MKRKCAFIELLFGKEQQIKCLITAVVTVETQKVTIRRDEGFI